MSLPGTAPMRLGHRTSGTGPYRSLCGVQPGQRRPGSESTRVALVERAVGRRKRLPDNWR
jgi:hypothetical protein